MIRLTVSLAAYGGRISVNARRRPPRVATSLSWPSSSPNFVQQRLDLGLERSAVERQIDRRRGALEAVQVLGQREGPSLIEADHLEDPVSAQQAVVGCGHQRLGPGHDPAVDAGQLGCGHQAARLSERRGARSAAHPTGRGGSRQSGLSDGPQPRQPGPQLGRVHRLAAASRGFRPPWPPPGRRRRRASRCRSGRPAGAAPKPGWSSGGRRSSRAGGRGQLRRRSR